MKITFLMFPLLLSTYVSAHGFVWKLGINTQTYTGNLPGATPAASVIREITTQDPVKGAANPSLSCGQSSTAGSLVADANPGDAVTFDWRGGGLNNWPHSTGPMLTYMASCGLMTCNEFDVTQAKWFKIQQVGLMSGSTWYLANVAAGAVANSSIPSNLAPGNYLIRHEIIALQIAVSAGGAEFYPACGQLRVGGDQTGAPKPSELVSFPGAYSDTDPGIYTPDVYNPGFTYTFPGPPIASFISGDASINKGPTSGNTTTPSTTTASTSSPFPSSSASSKTCRIVKGSTAQKNPLLIHARHVSRIIKKLSFSNALAAYH